MLAAILGGRKLSDAHRDEIRRLLIEQRALLIATEQASDLSAANAEYLARRAELDRQLSAIHVSDPLRWSNVYHWVGDCAAQGLDADGRASLLAVEIDPILAILEGRAVDAPAYTLELYERGGDPHDVPLSRFAFEELTETKRAALLAALERVLAYQGTQVVSTGWGKNLGGGLYEFKIRKTAAEIAALHPDHPGKTPVPEGLPPEDVKLRVFFAARGEKLLLVLSGYDKGVNDKDKRQQEEIKEARKYLREYDERLKREAKRRR